MDPELIEDDDDVPTAEDDQHDDDTPGDDGAAGEGETQGQDGAAGDEPGEVVVSIGDEPAQDEDTSRAPEWVRELRKANREKDRKLRQLEDELQRVRGATQDQVQPLGARPTLQAFDYDEDKFAAALDQWHERKRAIDNRAAQAEQQQREAQQAWQAKLADYNKAKAALKVRDAEDAEEVATQIISPVQQGVIVNGAENPALVVYALGRNPKKAKELAAIADPVKFAFAVAKLEAQLKITPKKSAPPPERAVRGSSGISAGSSDAALERLQAEAAKTGDRTKVAAYMRAKAAKAR